MKIKSIILPFLIVAIAGMTGCTQGPSFEAQQYHWDENGKLFDKANAQGQLFQDSCIKYLGQPPFRKYMDSVDKYQQIESFIIHNTRLPK